MTTAMVNYNCYKSFICMLHSFSWKCCLVYSFFLFFLFSIQAHAQSSTGIGISPATIEGGANPGETQTHTVTVSNLSATKQIYYLYLRDISGVKDGGVPIFAEENQEKTGYELTEWISLDVQELDLNPGEEKKVTVTIAVPLTATPGSHFGGVFITLEPPRMRATGASVGYEVANIISIRVAGDAVERFGEQDRV